jgi:hypothetical protein
MSLIDIVFPFPFFFLSFGLGQALFYFSLILSSHLLLSFSSLYFLPFFLLGLAEPLSLSLSLSLFFSSSFASSCAWLGLFILPY